jgi:pimeloyl-ACP methyl ester carboxylesterase
VRVTERATRPLVSAHGSGGDQHGWRFGATAARVPALVVQCRDDAIAPPTGGAWVAAHMPQSTLHQLAAGHCPHMTHPTVTVAAIRAYLETHLQPQTPPAARPVTAAATTAAIAAGGG